MRVEDVPGENEGVDMTSNARQIEQEELNAAMDVFRSVVASKDLSRFGELETVVVMLEGCVPIPRDELNLYRRALLALMRCYALGKYDYPVDGVGDGWDDAEPVLRHFGFIETVHYPNNGILAPHDNGILGLYDEHRWTPAAHAFAKEQSLESQSTEGV